MMRILNLYCGIGGNRKYWNGDITAVDNHPDVARVYSSLYPSDTVLITCAHQYLLEHFKQFDFIWSSPPCQSHSRSGRSGRNKIPRYPDMSLYQEIIFLRSWYKGHWVVENVVPFYKPLIPPDFKLGRHLFWASFPIPSFTGDVPNFPGFIANNGSAQALKNWLGIQYSGNVYLNPKSNSATQVLRNALHPIIGDHIFRSIPGSW